jgi:hypothetical protein
MSILQITKIELGYIETRNICSDEIKLGTALNGTDSVNVQNPNNANVVIRCNGQGFCLIEKENVRKPTTMFKISQSELEQGQVYSFMGSKIIVDNVTQILFLTVKSKGRIRRFRLPVGQYRIGNSPDSSIFIKENSHHQAIIYYQGSWKISLEHGDDLWKYVHNSFNLDSPVEVLLENQNQHYLKIHQTDFIIKIL